MTDWSGSEVAAHANIGALGQTRTSPRLIRSRRRRGLSVDAECEARKRVGVSAQAAAAPRPPNGARERRGGFHRTAEAKLPFERSQYRLTTNSRASASRRSMLRNNERARAPVTVGRGRASRTAGASLALPADAASGATSPVRDAACTYHSPLGCRICRSPPRSAASHSPCPAEA